MLRYLTAGESHGPRLTAILEGIPAGLPLAPEHIDLELARRQMGYGRGKRMDIEQDRVEITSGVRGGYTLASPITLNITNRDWENWQKIMAIEQAGIEANTKLVTQPRPGHADLSGGIKYAQRDLRNVLERSSARETAVRVAVGAVCKQLLSCFYTQVISHVVEIGPIRAEYSGLTPQQIMEQAENSPVRCADEAAATRMMELIDQAKANGDSVGGVFEIIVTNLPVGLGSYVHWDRKLDGRLAKALMSIQAIKGVEVGLGFEASRRFGSEVHDELFYNANLHRFYRKTNRAGGIEGGMSNGENILLRAAMKPIPTLKKALSSVDIVSKKPFPAARERSDICAVPAAGVIGEAVVAYELARVMLEKFGSDSLEEMKRNYAGYMEQVKEF
jgi:chorismate synthase